MEVTPEPSGEREVDRGWDRRARLLVALNVAAMMLLAVGVAVALNVAGDRLVRAHPSWRGDWSEEALNTLSPETLETLRTLSKRVRIVHFYRPAPGDVAEIEVAVRVQMLLEDYARQSDQIELEIVDVLRNPRRAQEVVAELGLSTSGGDSQTLNVTVFLSGSQRKDVIQRDVARILPADHRVKPPREAQIVSYNAEEPFTQAIRAVTDERAATVYWLEGHGEAPLEDATAQTGVSRAARAMRRDNFRIQPLNLAASEVPLDADVLVAFGPTRGPGPGEAETIRAFLGKGGKLLLLADPGYELSEWNSVIADYGVRFTDPDVVVWDVQSFSIPEPQVPVVIGGYSFSHPVTRALFEQRTPSVWPQARPLVVSRDRREVQVEALVFSSAHPGAWGERLRGTGRNGRYDEGEETPGPLNLLVACDERHPSGARTRLVVGGDTDFARNAYFEAFGNRDLLENAMNWLADRSRSTGIKPNLGAPRKVIVTAPVASTFFWGTALAMPGFILLLGGVILWSRRR
jgi:ABC-type uncharacterized transport system involved in gliding motility auxiliary subunit